MGKKGKKLSQAEVWDDSALIQSWDDALEEYKLYHSIHARGELVQDVLRESGLEDEDVADVNGHGSHETTTAAQPNHTASDDLEEGQLEEGELEDGVIEELKVAIVGQVPDNNDNSMGKAESVAHPKQPNPPYYNTTGQSQGLSSVPSAILTGVQDDALKNLMMSWYYAGYYTGLYEGQRQAAAT